MDLPKVEWTTTSRPPTINVAEVHIWRIDLTDFSDATEYLFQILSADERQRADRYHLTKDRNNFTIRRAALRIILGSYVEIQPAEIHFIYNEFDKPSLKTTTPGFNASSSNEMGIVAVTRDSNIGVDLEFADTAFPKLEIAEKYFSSDEVRALRDLKSEMQTTAFFECWTKKEAYVKAVGEGMARPLPNLTISSEKPDSFSITAKYEEIKGLSVTSFLAEENYIASLAYEGRVESVSYFKLPAI